MSSPGRLASVVKPGVIRIRLELPSPRYTTRLRPLSCSSSNGGRSSLVPANRNLPFHAVFAVASICAISSSTWLTICCRSVLVSVPFAAWIVSSRTLCSVDDASSRTDAPMSIACRVWLMMPSVCARSRISPRSGMIRSVAAGSSDGLRTRRPVEIWSCRSNVLRFERWMFRSVLE